MKTDDDDNDRNENELLATRKMVRGHYHQMDYATKLNVLNKFIEFNQNPPTIEGKKQSFEAFCRALGEEISGKWQSIKTLCLNYNKNPNILTQLEFLTATQTSAKKVGQIFTRTPRLTYDEALDKALVDWMYGCIEVGYILTREAIVEKAKELILPTCPNFKASDPWLKCFLNRHNFSLRKLNEKSQGELIQLEELSNKLKLATKQTIKKFNIPNSLILNMDETPYYWEYLPRKIITPKLCKVAAGWKRGYQHCRSTLMLTVAADGTFLRPALILQRKTPYILKCNNEINMEIMNSNNGWADENVVIKWIKDVILPYVKDNHCMLLWDTYEAHKSDKVLNFLKKYPNIHTSMIVGGRTSLDQPLDISINKQFKTICKKESIKSANTLLKYLEETRNLNQGDNIDNKIVRSNYYLF